MKKLLIFIFLAISLLTQSFLGFSRPTLIYPVYDLSEAELPRQLRTALPMHIRSSSLNLQGFNLKISGSGQFSEKSFGAMIPFLSISPENLIVIDLRQESHGFINEEPVSWTDGSYNYANISKTRSEVEADESLRLRLVAQAKQVTMNPLKKPMELIVYKIKTERELVESYGATYIRLPVTDHNRPSDEVIDQFIELLNHLSPHQWIHMHCKGGRGRTTTFLALFDMMRNAHNVSLNDILARQHLIGGVDLTEVQKEDPEKTRAAKERLELMRKFYLYCQQQRPNFQVRWSDWVKSPK